MNDSLSVNEGHSRMKLQMQSNPRCLARTNLQDQIAVMHVERLAFWESLCSAARRVSRTWLALLDDRRKQKWIWVILLALASYESYLVRALLAALFFITILFGALVALPTLYILLAHAFYCGILWTASVGDSFHSLLQHRVASPARAPASQKVDRVFGPVNPTHRPTRSRRK
jgi:hypothetical protein